MLIGLQFIACMTIILFAGTNLSKYGDIIAEKVGLGRTWIGIALLASVTSLPELITGISAVALFDVPNIAAGDVLGSCVFNILIIALLDFMNGPTPLSTRVHQGQVLTAAFGMLLLGLVSIGMVASTHIPALGWMSGYSLLSIAIYLVAIRSIFLYERKRIAAFVKEIAAEIRYEHVSKSTAYTMYGVNALLILGAGTYLPHLGEQIAEITGLGQTFVGNILIALSTSLPEVVVSIAAVKIDAVDMAIGNLFGSNLFNMAILAIDDIFYTKGPLLLHISGNHLITANAAVAMTAIATIGLTYRASKKHLFFSYDSLGIVAIYFFVTYLLYLMR